MAATDAPAWDFPIPLPDAAADHRAYFCLVDSSAPDRPPPMACPAYVHPTADVQTVSIGAGTTIWQFCVVLKDAVIGSNVNICSHCFIENAVRIGNNVTVKNGVCLFDGITLEDNVFIGPNATFTNDKFPRSKDHSVTFPVTLVRNGASIGGGAVILPGITIGAGAMIGAGAVVTKNVPDGAVVYGTAATPRRLIDAPHPRP